MTLLLEWHGANPAEESERHRNAAIAETQGNRNPLVDHAEWAERIDFDASFSVEGAGAEATAVLLVALERF